MPKATLSRPSENADGTAPSRSSADKGAPTEHGAVSVDLDAAKSRRPTPAYLFKAHADDEEHEFVLSRLYDPVTHMVNACDGTHVWSGCSWTHSD